VCADCVPVRSSFVRYNWECSVSSFDDNFMTGIASNACATSISRKPL